MNNVLAQHNLFGGADPMNQRNSDSLVKLVNMACTMSGISHFGKNCGGSVINAVSSNLTITGNLTVSDGYAYQGGGIRLDTNSYLFLNEPLVAYFINNNALQGSAIFAPVHESTAGGINTEMINGVAHIVPTKPICSIQIVPNHPCSQGNLSNINIQLHFNKTGLESSLYAPDFNFLGRQTSSNLLFDSYAWDPEKCQFVYTSLIDTIFKGEDEDKYTSLDNGICFWIREKQMNCSYVDSNYHYYICGQIPTVDVYPGITALSLVCDDNKEYQFSYSYQLISYNTAILEVGCETRDYEFWNTSLSANNVSLIFHNSDSKYIPSSYTLYLRNL